MSASSYYNKGQGTGDRGGVGEGECEKRGQGTEQEGGTGDKTRGTGFVIDQQFAKYFEQFYE